MFDISKLANETRQIWTLLLMTLHDVRRPGRLLVVKSGEFRSISHNIADSLASGIGLLIGYYEMDVFAEASQSAEGFITIDFLNGLCLVGDPSPSLARAIEAYKDALADLCSRHGTSIAEFRELTVRYSTDVYGRRFIVTVEDQQGRRFTDEYVGVPGRRPRALDLLGRVRKK